MTNWFGDVVSEEEMARILEACNSSPVGGHMVVNILRIRSCNVDNISPSILNFYLIMQELVTNVKGKETSHKGKSFQWPQYIRLSSLMYGALIS